MAVITRTSSRGAAPGSNQAKATALRKKAPPRDARPIPKLGYLPALDGIRAIAVLAVLVFHSSALWLPGGFLGVDVFFVLSGFLITSILLREAEINDRINFGSFYLRRARRLLPALILVLVASTVLVLLLAHDAAARLSDDIISAAAYVTNWANIAHGQSYFEAVGRPPLLQHLWSLGVEEQFYLLWPLILLIAYRWRGRFGVRRVALVGAVASTVLMGVLSIVWDMPAGADASRLYFGTDTHAMTVLAGAALAAAWRPHSLATRLSAVPRLALSLAGAGALAAILWAFMNVDETSAALYRGGFLIFAGLCSLLIVIATHPAIAVSRLLSVQPLRYLGERSYGLYLWHWPIFMVTRPGIDIGWTGVPAFAFQMALTLSFAELSYRFVEMPIRDGGISRTWRRWLRLGPLAAIRRTALALVATTAVCGALAIALLSIPPVDASTYLGGTAAVGNEPLTDSGTPSETGGRANAPARAPTTPSPVLPAQPGEDLTKRSVTAVGDSVMLGAHAALKHEIRRATVDAAVSRQSPEMFARICARKASGHLGDVVVIHAGTNGPAYDRELRAILNVLTDRARVVLLTSHMPDRWMKLSNDTVRTVAKDFANVRVADWAATSEGHRDFFVFDGTHLTPPGTRAYASTISATLRAP